MIDRIKKDIERVREESEKIKKMAEKDIERFRADTEHIKELAKRDKEKFLKNNK